MGKMGWIVKAKETSFMDIQSTTWDSFPPHGHNTFQDRIKGTIFKDLVYVLK